MFHMGDTDHLWQKFIEDPSYWQEYYVSNGLAEGPVNGEQNFIDNHINIKRQYLPKEWFGKYYDKEMDYIQSRWLYYIDKHSVFYLNEFFDERVKMIHFANANNLIENYKENWIKAHWE